jgi:pantoate kinase
MAHAVAFSPGHISGFFQPSYELKNICKTGSRGVGFSVVLGAISHVSIEKSNNQKVVTYLNGKTYDSPLIKECIRYLLSDAPVKITVKTRLDLPLHQGFGMSAASVLSMAYAASSCLHIPKENAVKAAHTAEVQLKTGLGDIAGSLKGGFEVRSKPGLPPYGLITTFYYFCDIVLCVVEEGIITKDILSDKDKQRTIHKYGGLCTDKFLKNPSVENFFVLSEFFTRKTGLATNTVLQAIDAAKTYGAASMCMLGTAVFSTGNTKQLVKTLSDFGKVYVTTIDLKGVRSLPINKSLKIGHG